MADIRGKKTRFFWQIFIKHFFDVFIEAYAAKSSFKLNSGISCHQKKRAQQQQQRQQLLPFQTFGRPFRFCSFACRYKKGGGASLNVGGGRRTGRKCSLSLFLGRRQVFENWQWKTDNRLFRQIFQIISRPLPNVILKVISIQQCSRKDFSTDLSKSNLFGFLLRKKG